VELQDIKKSLDRKMEPFYSKDIQAISTEVIGVIQEGKA
jgi:hypothetical protein